MDQKFKSETWLGRRDGHLDVASKKNKVRKGPKLGTLGISICKGKKGEPMKKELRERWRNPGVTDKTKTETVS